MKLAIAFAALALTTGCGRLDFTQTLVHPISNITLNTAQGVEVVSGAVTGTRTAVNGYTVDASVGAVRDKLQLTTANGYQVYNGVSATTYFSK